MSDEQLKRLEKILRDYRKFTEELRSQHYSDDLAQLAEDIVNDVQFALDGP